MGFGDALLGVGIARKAHQKHPQKKVCIGDGSIVEWVPEIHDGNPYLAKRPEPGCIWVHSHKSFRPYVDIEKSSETKYVWRRGFKASPGELFLRDEEKEPHKGEFRWVKHLE